MTQLRSITAAVAIAVIGAACNDTSVAVEETPTGGTTRTLLTDAPFPYDRVARVDLYIVSVSASLSPDTGSTGSFVTLATPRRRINLLDLQGGVTDELGKVNVPSGAITAVRMVIDTDSSSITLKSGLRLTGSSNPGIHWQSSAGRPTLNALIHEQIKVPKDGATIVIDYDVGRAFIPPQEVDPASKDSGFIFSPVIRAADAGRTGSIAGSVRAKTTTGSPVANASLRLYLGSPNTPENTWSTLATARTDANGAFRFAFVTQSAYWASLPAQAGKTYIIAIDPPSGSGLGRMLRQSLTVSPNAETAAGTIVLP
jgi:hypothetical protein